MYIRNQRSSDCYAFIDSQNLNLAIRHDGWKLDFQRFRVFLKRKYGAEKAFLFIGNVPGNESLYSSLQEMGYILVFKPTLQNREGVTIKGNCDAELVLHTMIQYSKFSKAILVSGDGDFHCLIEYLESNNKLFKVGIPDRQRYSALLRKFRRHFFFVSDLKHLLAQKKR